MAREEAGWPFGLQPVNANVRVSGEREYYGSASFNTLLSGSPTNSSTDFSSDVDTESTGSFFHCKSTTLGRLMGVPTTADHQHTRRRRAQIQRPINSNNCRPKTWRFSFCPLDTTSVAHIPQNHKTNYVAPSLGQFLAVERRAGNANRRGPGPIIVGPGELDLAQPELNSLFVNGLVAPPRRASPLFVPRIGRREDPRIIGGEGHGPLLFSCMCS